VSAEGTHTQVEEDARASEAQGRESNGATTDNQGAQGGGGGAVGDGGGGGSSAEVGGSAVAAGAWGGGKALQAHAPPPLQALSNAASGLALLCQQVRRALCEREGEWAGGRGRWVLGARESRGWKQASKQSK
jgi:hypothetical protein